MEAMVGLVVLGLLMSSIYLLLVFSLRARRQTEVFQEVHQQVEVAMSKVGQELAGSKISTVSYGSSPYYVIFLSLEKGLDQPDRSLYTYSGAGLPEWHKWVCFFLDESDHTLKRAEIELLPGPVTVPPAPAPPLLTDFQTSDTARTVARNIDQFEVVAGSTLETVRLTITSQAMVNSDNATATTLSSEVRVQN